MTKKPLLSPAKYMFDAQLNYLVDAGYTRIYLQADCRVAGVMAHRNDDIINFAVQAAAVKHYVSNEHGVGFEAMLDKRVTQVWLPWISIIGIFPPDESFLGIPNIQDPWGIEYVATGITTDKRLEIFRESQEENPLKEVADQIWPPKETKTPSKLRIVE